MPIYESIQTMLIPFLARMTLLTYYRQVMYGLSAKNKDELKLCGKNRWHPLRSGTSGYDVN